MNGARHLYVHLPFCSSRCGYCDFVTVVGRNGEHGGYVDALLRELDLERPLLAAELESVYLGGGTPTLTEPRALEQLLGSLPAAHELTVEANPETVTPQVAALLAGCGVDRVSLGAQTFSARLLRTLGRVAQPDDVRSAVYRLRDAGIDNISLDLIYGIPGQEPADLARDLAEALALEPEHISAYELEAKPGTRFTHAHGAELERQAESLESYFERVVETQAEHHPLRRAHLGRQLLELPRRPLPPCEGSDVAGERRCVAPAPVLDCADGAHAEAEVVPPEPVAEVVVRPQVRIACPAEVGGLVPAVARGAERLDD
ncbi:MAG TPA: coproporphyrinogen-III oxidase family protein, partial [Gaiellaceae bacterium]